MHPEVRRYYDDDFDRVNYAGTAGWATRQTHQAVERGLGPHLLYPRVLELGAAHADHVRFVRHGYDEYHITDLEDHGLDLEKLAAELPPGNGLRRLSTGIADAQNLPFEDDSFDRTVHTCLLHHLPDPEAALREMRRVVKPGGRISIYLPCDPGLAYSVLQRATTGRKQKKALREGNYTISGGYLRALEHPNHYPALIALAREVFHRDHVTQRNFPLPLSSFHMNLFTVLQVDVT